MAEAFISGVQTTLENIFGSEFATQSHRHVSSTNVSSWMTPDPVPKVYAGPSTLKPWLDENLRTEYSLAMDMSRFFHYQPYGQSPCHQRIERPMPSLGKSWGNLCYELSYNSSSVSHFASSCLALVLTQN